MKVSLRLSLLLLEALQVSDAERYLVKYMLLISNIKKYMFSIKKIGYDPKVMSIELAYIIKDVSRGLDIDGVLFYKHIPFISVRDAKDRVGGGSFVRREIASTKTFIKRLLGMKNSQLIRIRLPLSYSNYRRMLPQIFSAVNDSLLQSVIDLNSIEDQDKYSSSDNIANRLLSHERASGNILSLILGGYANKVPVATFSGIMKIFTDKKPPSAIDTFKKLKMVVASSGLKIIKLMDYENGIAVHLPDLPAVRDIFYIYSRYGEPSIERDRLLEFVTKAESMYTKYAVLFQHTNSTVKI